MAKHRAMSPQGVKARTLVGGVMAGGAMAMAGIVCGLIALLLTSVLYIGLLSFLHFGAPALQKALDQQSQQIQKHEELISQSLTDSEQRSGLCHNRFVSIPFDTPQRIRHQG